MVTPILSSDAARQIERARTGDAAAFEALLRHYERPLYGFIYRIMGSNPEDAADLLQETFLKVYRALDRVPPDVNLSAWLYRIARNCCLDEIRRRKRGQWVTWDGGYGTPMIETPPE